MKSISHKIILPLMLILLAIILCGTLLSRKRYPYVGIDACRRCHAQKSVLDQYIIWKSSPHANAVVTLGTKKAREIGAKIGVLKPEDDIKCLKCHTTGGGKVELTRKEGVGCESCHGPGGGYIDFSNHVDYLQKKRGYTIAKKHGMYPILDYEDNLINREKLCLYCHNDKRPCMPLDIKGIKKQKISIQVIDKLRKGNLNFHHPPRKY